MKDENYQLIRIETDHDNLKWKVSELNDKINYLQMGLMEYEKILEYMGMRIEELIQH